MPDDPIPTKASRLFNQVTAYYDQKARNRRRRAEAAAETQTSEAYATLHGSAASSTSLEAARLPDLEVSVASQPLGPTTMSTDTPSPADSELLKDLVAARDARFKQARDVVATMYPDAPHVQSLRRLQAMTLEQIAQLAADGEADAIATIEESGQRFMQQRQAELLKSQQ